MSRTPTEEILKNVQENQSKLRSCLKHKFRLGPLLEMRAKIVYGAGTPMVLSDDLSELADYPTSEVRIFVDAAQCDPHLLLELVDGMSHEPLLSKLESIGAVESRTSFTHCRVFTYGDILKQIVVPIEPGFEDYNDKLAFAIGKLAYLLGISAIELIVELRRANG